VLVIVAVVFLGLIFAFWGKSYPNNVLLNGSVIQVEIADDAVVMAKGLSGHKPLGSSEGMLFIFGSPGDHGFWMKDMTFSIDIIWFDKNKKIIHIEKSLSPETYPKTYSSKSDSLYVLELMAGTSDKLGLKIGDSFSFIKNTGRNLGI
ncbi:MAG: DUF192 domain-containing protein, partial [Minisyncoccia bacterium]